MSRLLISADDRTGALEVGGILAGVDRPVPVARRWRARDRLVVDIDTRHVSPREAAARVSSLHREAATLRAHKMDSGLRGNWPHEARALAEEGFRVMIVPAWPEAGRTCIDGTVYIQGKPVLESPFGQDPFSRPSSSKPAEVLAHAGCDHPNIGFVDAWDDSSLADAVARTLAEDRFLVGPTGAVGAYVSRVLGEAKPAKVSAGTPVLVACGSLNPTSHAQLAELSLPTSTWSPNTTLDAHSQVLVTPKPPGSPDGNSAQAMASAFAATLRDAAHRFATIIVIGGDTTAAFLGEDTVEVLGMMAPGIPAMRLGNTLVITKGGGIGTRDTLRALTAGLE